jgi:uncharacterized protein (DUF2336 family)
MLTGAHLRALRDTPSVSVRADIAVAVAVDFAAASLTPAETQIAEQILAALAQDVERSVRRALAEHVKECPLLPAAVAARLARDIEDEVALPILEHSPCLADADLVLQVTTGNAERRLAVARRDKLTPLVADALAAIDDRQIVGAVLANHGAELSDDALLKVALRFAGDVVIDGLLVERPVLPLAVCEMLIARVSASLRERLVVRHRIPAVLAEELAMHGRERALAALLPNAEGPAAAELALHLQTRHRLTPSLVLRALCLGDLAFFESAMAVLSGVPPENAKSLLYDRGLAGFRALYQRTGLPLELFRAFRVGVAAILDGRLEGGRAAFTQHIIDQLVLLYEEMCPAGIEHVLAQLAHRATAPERQH